MVLVVYMIKLRGVWKMNGTIKRDITNGASNKAKLDIEYGFWEECKIIWSLVCRHSLLYVIKFMFLILISAVVACVYSETYHSLVVNVFILLSGLFFDQLGKKNVIEDFDFKRAEHFCYFMVVYIAFFLILAGLILILGKEWFASRTFLRDCWLSFTAFKIMAYFVMFTASFGALVEAIVNIPTETLPNRQQKTNGQNKKSIVNG